MPLLKRFWWVIALVLVALYAINGINTIPTLDEQVNASWAQVQNQYERRADLIPNLVETVKGVANFEKTTLTQVIEARADASKITISPETLSDPAAMQKYQAAQGQITSALSHLMMVSEQYPQLKADENFLSLQSQLEGTENRIAVARRDYIATVRDYNVRVRTFPGSLWAAIAGARPKAEFTAAEGDDKAPAVKF